MIWGATELLTFLFSMKSQALHDFIAGTVVIKKKKSELLVPMEA